MASQSQFQNKELVWLITGTSSGIGRDLTLAALARNDKVIATARAKSLSKLHDLQAKGAKVLEMDVTASLERLKDVARNAVGIYGRVDVLVNNAGYVLFGALEENTPQETYDQFSTNFFGALNVTRAFLPYMREKRTGTVVWIGSMYGLAGCAYAGIYAATKWALRGTSLTLHDEISPLGLRSTCIDFGFFRTSVLAPGNRATKKSGIEDYKEIAERMEGLIQAANGNQPGDPTKGVQAILDVVRGEGQAEGKSFPTELVLGTDCYHLAKEEAERHLKMLEEWREVSCGTDFKE